jgi:hypothetical protein
MSQEAAFLATVQAHGDPAAESLIANAAGEWVRSRFGILGLMRLPERLAASDWAASLQERTSEAYGLLDALAPGLLTADDVWSLLLFVSVPWGEEEVSAAPELRRILQEYAADLRGSRKIVLWSGQSPAEFLGRVGINQSELRGLEGDPVGSELSSLAMNARERDAFQILLQRRISETDLEDLISVLAGGEAS